MSRIRRVWATITVDVFERFVDRCKKQGLRVPSVFAALVERWGDGDIDLPSDRAYNRRQHGNGSDG